MAQEDVGREGDVDTARGNGVGQSGSGEAEIRPAADRRRSKRGRAVGDRYTDAEREHALVAVAWASGNSRRAAASLEEQGFPVPERTLRLWKRDHAELYQRVEQDVLPRVRAELASDFTDLARYELAVARKVLDRLHDEADDPEKLPTRDLPGALRNVKVSGAVGVDKAAMLRDEPTSTVRHISVAETLRSLKALGVVIEGAAEDVTDAEVVEPPALPSAEQPPS